MTNDFSPLKKVRGSENDKRSTLPTHPISISVAQEPHFNIFVGQSRVSNQ